MASNDTDSGERVAVVRTEALPGIELWEVRESARRWTAYATSYSFSALTRPVLRGERLWRYRGAVYAMTASSARLVEPNELHTTLRAAPASFLSFEIDPARMRQLCRDRARGGVRFRVGQLDDATAVRCLLKAARAFMNENMDPLVVEEALLGFLERALELHGDAPSRAEPLRSERGIARAREYLHTEFRSTVRLDDLAEAAGLSKYHLARSFRRAYGVGLHRYLVHVRLGHAMVALRSRLPLTDVARVTGFCDQPHFTRMFRTHFGLTPAAYRQSSR